MLGQFPVLYPDEDFRSIVYRYHLLSGNKDFSNSSLELFELKTYKNSILPRNLTFLLKQLPANSITLESLIYNHMFFYLLKPFIPGERIESIINEIKYNEGKTNIAYLLGKGSGRLITEKYRYCPACAANDQLIFGEAYLHRKHQLLFLTVCPDHGCELLTQCPKCNEEFENNLVISLKCVCGFDISKINMNKYQADRMEMEKEILDNFEQLLDSSKLIHLEDILLKMRNILGGKEYIKYTGRFDRKKLFEDFQNYLNINNYNKVLNINVHSQMKTDAFILSGNQVKSILFYILFMMFLAGSVEEFYRDNSTFSIPIPFGNGPWLCDNSVCPEYNQPIIKKCVRIDHLGKYISGLFGCPMCGFSYSKRWRLTDQGNEKPYAVLTKGHLWHSILMNLHSSGLNNNQIAVKMNSTATQITIALNRMREPRSDKRILQSINNLWNSNNINDEVAASIETPNYHEEGRARIIELLENNPGITRTELAKKHSHLYHSMLRGDRRWMEDTLPPSRKNRVRTDWEKLDIQYCKDLAVVAEEVYRSNPPEQIKKYTILAQAPKCIKEHIEYAAVKLPKSIELLNSKVETNDKYLLRHLPVIIRQMKKYNKKVDSLENIKTFSPMYRKSTGELDEKLTTQLNDFIE